MTLYRTICISLAFTLVMFAVNGQVDDRSWEKVLNKGIIDSTLIFGKWTEDGGMETHLRYLGKVTTRHGQTFKIVNSIWYWGLSHRATSRILIFNNNNQYVGNYVLNMTYHLPGKLINGKLIFFNTNDECDKKITTIVNLRHGLPTQFFRKCKGDYGDIYSFD